MSKLYAIIGLVVALGAIILGILWFGNHQYDNGFEAGKQSILAAQATAQVKHDKEVKQRYGKIDRSIPNASNHTASDKFLLEHTRSDSE